LWSSPQDDLISYGYQLITNTQRYLGPHLRAGLQPYAAPFVSTNTSFPMQRTSPADSAVKCSEFTARAQSDPHGRSPSANWHRASFH
jgi:cytochrome c